MACTIRRILLVVVVWLSAIAPAGAYPVGPSLTLDELIAQAEYIGKVTALESKPIADAWFEKVHAFSAVETRLKVIASYKGQPGGETISFRHYGPADPMVGHMYMPQHYRFEPGRTYIVFAAAADKPGVFRQLWKNHKLQEDQGLVLAASNEPHADKQVKEIVFLELTGHLKSGKAADVKYGLDQLNLLSGGTYEKQHDFDREEVLDYVKRLLTHRDNEVVLAAIGVMGSNNPYMSPDFAPGWLATVGQGGDFGWAAWDRERENLGGKLYWKQLAAIADSDAPAATRARAIRALGRAEEPAILPLVQRWTGDAEPLVRQAAAVLLADFPGEFDPQILTKLAADAQPEVRRGAAQAIGFGQFKPLVPTLGKLLADGEEQVHSAAAMSLLSFSTDDSGDVLRANVKHTQYHSLFVNALARKDTAAYVDELAEIIKKKKEPENFWGGRIPWGVSWELLFFHAQRQPAEKLKSGELNKVLDALEYPASGDAAGPSYYSSSEPRDLYALYVQRGMKDRAAKFRELANKNSSYNIDYFFKQVDQNPQNYQRQ